MRQNQNDMIARLDRALAPDYRLMPVHETGTPVFLAMALPMAEGVSGLKPRLPAGRGLTLPQAIIAAGAEAVELRASLAQSRLAKLADGPRQGGLACVTMQDMASGAEASVLAQEVYLDCAALLMEPLRYDATSNGCAAGETPDAAAAAALWECVERDAVALWWHGGWAAGALPLAMIDQSQPRLSWWLDQRSRVTWLLDLTTDIGLPVVAAVSAEPDGRHIALGSAARPVLAEAAIAAVTEMVQTEVSMDQARRAADPEVLAWDAAADLARLPQFCRFDARPAALATRTEDLVARLADLGHRALWCDLTLPDDPLPSCRVMVPGLCAMGGRIQTNRFQRLCREGAVPQFPEPF
jgi:ribosomal protein S12 methylthiotransferase accessory factor YcaO